MSCRRLRLNEALGPAFSCEKLSLIRNLTKMATHRMLEARRSEFERSELGYPRGAMEDPATRRQNDQTMLSRWSWRWQARILLWAQVHSAPNILMKSCSNQLAISVSNGMTPMSSCSQWSIRTPIFRRCASTHTQIAPGIRCLWGVLQHQSPQRRVTIRDRRAFPSVSFIMRLRLIQM